MSILLRGWEADDEQFLWEMLYQSIHVAANQSPPPRSILDEPLIRHYLEDFGSRTGDDAVVACEGDLRIGAAFCRRFTRDEASYGFVDEDTPEVGMAVLPTHRGQGMGRAMLTHLLDRHPRMSLSVDSDNVVALALYETLGFSVVGSHGTSLTMFREC